MQWPVFTLGVLSTIVMAAVVGWLLTRWQVLPGTSAIWGSAPGGAASMTLLAEAYGADVRLVAFMQYLRVLCVTSVASLIATLSGQSHQAVAIVWFPPVDWVSFAATLAVASLGLISAKVFRIRAGAVLLPLIVGAVLSNMGVMHIELPPWFLAISYALLGWGIGLFIIGWIIQFLGHYYEGKTPAFVDDLVGLLVGPMFVVAEAMFSLGWGHSLMAEIERRVGPTVLRDLAAARS